MDKNEIISAIKAKIQEHAIEVRGSDQLREEISKQVKGMKEDLTNKSEADIIKVKNVFGLYEKVKFHQTCIIVLTDLLKEIEK